jgi:hypothetical protein
VNIFVLHENAREAARAQCDKHVPKMFLESLQLLCNAVPDDVRSSGAGLREGRGLFRPTHQNHPCTLWVKRSGANWYWLLQHAQELCTEYTLRFGRIHASTEVLNFLGLYKHNIRVALPEPFGARTPFVRAMPEEYREEDPVNSYRWYYRCAKTFAKYERGRAAPIWWEAYAPPEKE